MTPIVLALRIIAIVLHRIARLIVLGTLSLTIGLHWGILQSVAWVGMVVDYSQENSIGTAIEMTFDGKHPCRLCLAVQDGKKAGQPVGEEAPTNPKPELFALQTAQIDLAQPAVAEMRPGQHPDHPLLSSPPPLPPPRLS